MDVPVEDFAQWLDSKHYPEARKEMLRKAKASLESRPIRVSDSYVQMFVKVEKLLKPAMPRAIQPTSDRYLVTLGPFISSIEKVLTKRHDFLTKGLDYSRLGELYSSKLSRFACPVVLEVDFSKFDAHVDTRLLALEHAVYRRYCTSPVLAQLLSWQLETKGSSRYGWEYKRSGGRCSGHPNTSIGNALLHSSMHLAIARMTEITVELMVDGDDGMVIMEVGDANRWPMQWYEMFGFTIEWKWATPAEASYCSGHFMDINTPEGQSKIFVRSLGKAIAKIPWAIGLLTERQKEERAHDVLHADLALMPAVPVLSTLLDYWHRLYKCTIVKKHALRWGLRQMEIEVPHSAASREPDSVSRDWFQKVYGLAPCEQVLVESVVRHHGWHDWLNNVVDACRERECEHLDKLDQSIIDRALFLNNQS